MIVLYNFIFFIAKFMYLLLFFISLSDNVYFFFSLNLVLNKKILKTKHEKILMIKKKTNESLVVEKELRRC